jgi:diamine N-acetyltransferase
MNLRPATPGDATMLAHFARDAFNAAFADLYKPEDLDAFIAEWRTPERYLQKIVDPASRVQLAEVDGVLGAYCILQRDHLLDYYPEPHPARPAFLNQLYCAGGMTGLGLGAALMDWAIAQAREWQADAIALSVYSENFGAQRFYQRYGFARIADIHFWVGNQCDDEFLYELRL